MVVTLPADVLKRFERFSLYNSPYVAHDRGCAIDLYLEPSVETAISPVAGEVLDTRTVTAPQKAYAEATDHLIVIDCGRYVARTLHVDPAVEPGDELAVGEPLGRLVRAGFFAPWVDNHVHLGFREPDSNPYRASGSVPIALETGIEPLAWDGSGIVAETGRTYAILDAPAHPAPGTFAGIAGRVVGRPDRDGIPFESEGANDRESGATTVVLDGGLPHYDGGGALGDEADPTDGPVEFLGTAVGYKQGRDIAWNPVRVRANGRPITGLSLFCGRDAGFGAKLVCPDESFERGDRVEVTIHRSN